MSATARSEHATPRTAHDLCARHLRVGWWSLLAFLSGGIALETLHGFKAGFYLDVGNETRRLLWRRAPAHRGLRAMVNIVFALALRAAPQWTGRSPELSSRCLIGALILLPLGFLLGGAFPHGGDPGLGVLLVPPGALLLFVAVFLAARGASRPG
jgi:hypothetical protein